MPFLSRLPSQLTHKTGHGNRNHIRFLSSCHSARVSGPSIQFWTVKSILKWIPHIDILTPNLFFPVHYEATDRPIFFLHFRVSNRSILLIILKSNSVLFQAPWLLKAKHLMNSCVALILKRLAVSTTNAVQKSWSVALLRPRCLLIAALWITQCARMESVIEHMMGTWSKESPSLKDLSHHDLFQSSIAQSLKFTGVKMFCSVRVFHQLRKKNR